MVDKFRIHKPFSPSIGQLQIPSQLIDDINKYVESSVNNKKKNELDYGKYLAGEVSYEIRLPENFLNQGLLNFLAQSTKNYIKLTTGKDIKTFKLMASWVVRQYENEYNPIHWHNGHISGVGHIKIPDSFGDNIQKNKRANKHGEISFIHGSKMFLSNSVASFKPRVRDFYLFPNYLMHSVNPFYSSGERRSISFNAFIDDSIYNVYNLS